MKRVWQECYPSVCKLQFFNERGIVIDSLSGFKVGKSLVTCEDAFYIGNASKVEIRFVEEDANTITASVRIDYAEFINDLRVGVFNNNSDYAVFNIDFKEFESVPGLSLSYLRSIPIGSPVAVLGFNGDERNLSIRSAIISSAFSNGEGVRYLALDGLNCYGNSGSPVIDVESREVVGIISRRNSPATSAYQDLLKYITSNLDELHKLEGMLKLGTVDPIQVLVANQNQIKLLASNIYKYAATGTTRAVMLDKILSFFNEQHAATQEHHVATSKVSVRLK